MKELLKVLKEKKLTKRQALFQLEKNIIEDIRRIAILQYLYMRKTGDWGDLGEQRISISYCRYLLNIPNDREVTQADADRFEQLFSELSLPYQNLSPQELRLKDEEIKCDLFYKKVDYSREKDINAVLKFLGSTKGIIAGQLGIFRSIIFGEAEISQKDIYRVTVFKNELARTPANVLSIAAVVGGKHIAIRNAACETIFANKWLGFYKKTQQELFFELFHELENIGLAFKVKALLAYKANSKNLLLKKRKLFLKEMDEGLLWHELGHGIVINGLLSVEDSAFGEALGVLGANIIAVLKEILADWAPKKGKLEGPLSYFCRCAKINKIKATRMLYVYFSDNWFLSNDEDAFDNHTEIIEALIFKFVKKDSSIDFTKLRAELKSPKGIFWYSLAEYKRISKYLEEKISSAIFEKDGETISFAELKKIYAEKVRLVDKDSAEDSLEFLVLLWAKILEDLPRLNPLLLEEIKAYLTEQNQKFHRFIIEEYYKTKADNLRSLLLKQIKDTGFYCPVNIKGGISRLLQEMKRVAKISQKRKRDNG